MQAKKNHDSDSDDFWGERKQKKTARGDPDIKLEDPEAEKPPAPPKAPGGRQPKRDRLSAGASTGKPPPSPSSTHIITPWTLRVD